MAISKRTIMVYPDAHWVIRPMARHRSSSGAGFSVTEAIKRKGPCPRQEQRPFSREPVVLRALTQVLDQIPAYGK